MKTNKFLKWIYGILMALPLLSVLAMTLYVSFNKNAYQSYSDIKTITNVKITQTNNLQSGFTYVINDIDLQANTPVFFSDNANEICSTFNLPNTYTYVGFRIVTQGSNKFVYGYDTDSITSPSQYVSENHSGNLSWITDRLPLTFQLNSYYNTGSLSYISIYQQNIVNDSLDNAFKYSIQQFNDIGFDKVDFISFFDFFYQNTNIYTTFINCYANYILFVSLALFLPRVTLWFINLAFSMIDGFERKSQRW